MLGVGLTPGDSLMWCWHEKLMAKVLQQGLQGCVGESWFSLVVGELRVVNYSVVLIWDMDGELDLFSWSCVWMAMS